MKKSSLILVCLVFMASVVHAQKRALSFDDIEKWNRITQTIVSDDGQWVAYTTEPWKGDSEIKVYHKGGKEQATFKYGSGLSFTSDSRYLIYTVTPPAAEVRELKLKETSKEEMPKEALGIYRMGGTTTKVDALKSFKVPKKFNGWIALQVSETLKSNSDTLKSLARKNSEKNGYDLILKNLDNAGEIRYPFVKQYLFSDNGEKLTFVSTGDGNDFKAGVYLSTVGDANPILIFDKAGEIKQLSISESGKTVAFVYDTNEKNKSGEGIALYRSVDGSQAESIASSKTEGIPLGWIVSPDHRLEIEEMSGRLFFGTAPARQLKDSTRVEDEIPVVDIWHWQEGKLHTQQVNDRASDLKQSYLSVWLAEKGKVVQLGNPDLPVVMTGEEGVSDYALGISNIPYQILAMWEGSPAHYDVYLVNINDGKREMIMKDLRASVSISPSGKYLFWYNAMDTTWNSYKIATRTERKMSVPESVMAADETDDSPNYASSYYYAGWLKDDAAILIYDRYDIWKVDPDNKSVPVNLTLNGRSERINYRVVRTSDEFKFFNEDDKLFISGHNEVTRHGGYYTMEGVAPRVPATLISGPGSLGRPIFSKGQSTVVYTRETFTMFPDLHVTDMTFKKSIRISNANPQQQNFNWGTAELVSWTSLDGRSVDGLLYKPENFDSKKKYPMIVNFYDKSSEGLFDYRMPEAHRSTIDYHYYTSNGYLVFNPDIHYVDGYPGQSAYNAIMPGITQLISRGFVDERSIGAQGHSWGGYQVAYLATRTTLFAAIESGAPVVNMFSAYGGIRWGTGHNRAFQYEQDQSRIGKHIWDAPLRYIENSPIFTMDKVTTPILIMANDNDGHVPWYQGIEYFIALRRLGKPSWLLNYTGEVHWPQKYQNKKDFQIRMAQFFDHYLKGEPMPKWMKEGIPATQRDFDLGYGF